MGAKCRARASPSSSPTMMSIRRCGTSIFIGSSSHPSLKSSASIPLSRPCVAVAEWLTAVGLSAPEIVARDMDRGLLLLGDFGDRRLREFLDNDPARERELYTLATDLLVHLHRHRPMDGLRPHGLEQWL